MKAKLTKTPTTPTQQPKELQSPAIPKITSSSPDGTRIGFYYQKTEKKRGYTPDGKNIIPISSNRCGSSHGFFKKKLTGEIISSESPLSSEKINCPDHRKDFLFSLLRNMSGRVDQDSKVQRRNKRLCPNHYTFSIKHISKCQEELSETYKITDDKSEFLREINKKISSGWIYNPFEMPPMYSHPDQLNTSACTRRTLLKNITKDNFPTPKDIRTPKNRIFSPTASSSSINSCLKTTTGGIICSPSLYDGLPPPQNTVYQTPKK